MDEHDREKPPANAESQRPKSNDLVEKTKELGRSVRDAQIDKMHAIMRSIQKDHGSTFAVHPKGEPYRAPQISGRHTQKTGNADDANYRAVWRDKPLPGHGR